MPGQGRIIGIILIAIALIACLLATALLLAQVSIERDHRDRRDPGPVDRRHRFVLPLGGGGIYLLTKGQQEKTEYAEIEKQKKILNMVLAQGKVSFVRGGAGAQHAARPGRGHGARSGGQEPVQRRDQLERRDSLLQAGVADEGGSQVPQLRRRIDVGGQGCHRVPVLWLGSVSGELTREGADGSID